MELVLDIKRKLYDNCWHHYYHANLRTFTAIEDTSPEVTSDICHASFSALLYPVHHAIYYLS